MAGVLIGFGIIVFVIAVGYVAGRARLGGPSAPFVLNRVAFFVTSPALLFTVLARADLRVVFSAAPLVAGTATIVTAGLYLLASRLFFRAPVPETVIGMLGACYVNANNIGLPVSVYVLGSATYVAPVLLLQLIVFAPIALIVLDSSTRGRVSVRDILLQPVRNPMILASVAGLLVNVIGDLTGWRIPDAVRQPFELLGGAAVPLVLLAYGMSLHGARPLRSVADRMPVLAASLGKAVAMPVVAWTVASLLGLHGHALFSAVALGALPTAQNVFNFASRYQRGETIARDTVLVTTVASIPVLLAIAALFA